MRKLANRMQFGIPEESSLGNFTFVVQYFAFFVCTYLCFFFLPKTKEIIIR